MVVALLHYIPKIVRVQPFEIALYHRDHVLRLLKDQYNRFQSRIKLFAGQRRTEWTF